MRSLQGLAQGGGPALAHSGTIILLRGIPAQEVDEGKLGFLVRPQAAI